MNKPVASLSLDLDNKWAYLRAAGRDDWESASSYLPMVTRRINDLLGELALPLTVFVVGRDLESEQDCDAVRSFQGLGDVEFANHSLHHLPWMHTLGAEEIRREIEVTHGRVGEVTGETPLGFRGPGFSCPGEVLQVLKDLHYVYDASIFPTSLAPVARAVFLMRTQLKGQAREDAKKLYGGFSAMRNPNQPFRRNVDGQRLWEVPVTVMPLTRTPIHFSYFTYLAGFSSLAAKAYLRTAFRLCLLTGTPPSLLLHPPDFLGREDDADMAYFPAMNQPREYKLRIVRWGLKLFADLFDVKTMISQLGELDPNVSLRRQRHADQDRPMRTVS